MLDSETKRRIDTARDILVGKVPDPKSQVEQITIALIYKFMDDMDAEAEELGGKRKFFTAEFARFGWAKLMSPSVSGFELIGLYGEGISSMLQNPGIPALFRDIFKNAYLPYRDPETLKSFLKVIDGFSYDHSERLGDAFEYLLSVLGSQGDAGQFRTPRHIIDFMVELLNPQKDESILDPACGTAGFLISAWKHILSQNTQKSSKNTQKDDKNDSSLGNEYAGYKGNLLTPDERARLAANIKGYDISPDMVRLSLVNLYLHGFSDPHIVEYDTLTQDDKWNEVADVILANPPFMSPKGGIKPHKRFSVQATRSEVLFVDYMAEHLTATGRAAIVVPEGIIFQSGTAYKALRKMLVDTSLVAVISLPAGVFNPYSGVKTSILILDKRVHKQTDSVLFVKVQNDGYNLGAQRRAVTGDDLPEATRQLRSWMTAPQAFEGDSAMARVVARGRIGENGDFNLSGERYVVGNAVTSSFEFVALEDVIDVLDSRRRPITKQDRIPGPYPYYGATGELDRVHEFLFDEQLVLIGEDGAKWESGDKTAFAISGKTWVNNHAHVVRPQRDKLLDVYLIEILRQMDLSPYITGVTVPKLNQEKLRGIQIPLPPLEIQHQIVAEIEGYQKIIDGARQVLDNYKPQIVVDAAWPVVTVGDVASIRSGGTPERSNAAYWGGTIPWIKTGQIDFNVISEAEEFITQAGLENSAARMFPAGTILMAMYGQGVTRGRVAILNIAATTNQACAAIEVTFATADRDFLYWSLAGKYEELRAMSESRGGNQSNLNAQLIRDVKIALPDLATQRAIVAEIEAEQALVQGNRELVRRMEGKVKAAIDRVWGDATQA